MSYINVYWWKIVLSRQKVPPPVTTCEFNPAMKYYGNFFHMAIYTKERLSSQNHS